MPPARSIDYLTPKVTLGTLMAEFDVNAPVTLRWRSKDLPLERDHRSVREAAQFAMRKLSRAEFFSASILIADHVLSGDEIVEIFQTGTLARRGWAGF